MSDEILSLSPPPADQRIAYGTDPNQFGDLRLPKGKGPFPIVMNIHGGYWRAKYDLEHTGRMCADLTARGFATWNLEYRRVGNKGGGWPGTLADIASGFRFLPQLAKEHPVDPKRSLVIGHSAGGHLALCLAAHEPSVQFVISLAGVIDLMKAWELHLSDDAVVDLLGGTPQQVPEHYKDADPMQLSIPHAKQIVAHGLKDDIVPPEFSSHYAQKKQKAGENVQLVELANTDHFDVIDPHSEAWKQIVRLVESSRTSARS
jgi:acetyl esterase/lipase